MAFCHLKDFRRVAIRYALNFLSAVVLAANTQNCEERLRISGLGLLR